MSLFEYDSDQTVKLYHKMFQDERNELYSLMKDVNQLKTTTDLILSSINSLSGKLDNCVGFVCLI